MWRLKGKVQAKANQVILFERGKNLVNIFSSEGTELLLLGGRPHNEPVFAYGPFVMNSEEEIRKCYDDYRNGKMGNPALVNGKS
ncbi:MAG: hypothetical protein IPN54_07755 [Bacteroidetes bacterium]|nr:hypothetical protein [Bacteroidota bacterium]